MTSKENQFHESIARRHGAPPSYKDTLILPALFKAARMLLTPVTCYFLTGNYCTVSRFNLTAGYSHRVGPVLFPTDPMIL